jgi:surface antigen
MRNLALALFGAAALIAPAAAQAQAPMSSIFGCRTNNNSGAVIGGLLGGVIGNEIAGDDRRDRIAGTLLGAGVGAAIGSSIGCNMNSADTTRAESATRIALNQNRSSTWSNGRNGASGRVDIVNSFYRNDVAGRVPDYRYGPQDLNDIRFAPGVRMPARYVMVENSYSATAWLDVFAAPDGDSRVLDQLRDGERFDGIARVGGWLLVGQNGRAMGYVNERYADYEGRANLYAYLDSDYRYRQVTERRLCRTFDQTLRRPGGATYRERFTACQDRNGDWIVDS